MNSRDQATSEFNVLCAMLDQLELDREMFYAELEKREIILGHRLDGDRSIFEFNYRRRRGELERALQPQASDHRRVELEERIKRLENHIVQSELDFSAEGAIHESRAEHDKAYNYDLVREKIAHLNTIRIQQLRRQMLD